MIYEIDRNFFELLMILYLEKPHFILRLLIRQLFYILNVFFGIDLIYQLFLNFIDRDFL